MSHTHNVIYFSYTQNFKDMAQLRDKYKMLKSRLDFKLQK